MNSNKNSEILSGFDLNQMRVFKALCQLGSRAQRDCSLCPRNESPSDKAAFIDQKILRRIRERGEDTNLDRSLGVRACGHFGKAPQSGSFSLLFITEIIDHFVRENPVEPGHFQVH